MLLTNTSIERAIAREKSSTIYQDAKILSLRCRVTPKGASFYFYATVKGKRIRQRIGKHPIMSVDMARLICWNRINPQIETTAPTQAPTTKPQPDTVKSISYGELLTLYATNKRMKESTKASYEMFLRNSGMISLLMSDVTPKSFLDCFNAMFETYPTKAKKVASIIKSLARWYAIYSEQTIDDPTRLINTVAGVGIHSTNCRTRRLTPEMLPIFWRVLADRSSLEHDAITFTLLTAMRKNEVLSLTRANITVMGDSFTVTLETTKNGKAHSLPLVGMALEIVKRRLAESPDRLFPTQGKHAFKALNSAGVVLSWHDLRRSWASFSASGGVSDSMIKRVLNHSASDVTSRHYAFFDDDSIAKTLLDVEHIVRSNVGEKPV